MITDPLRKRIISAAQHHPSATRALLSLLSPHIPSRWIFHEIVHDCGGVYPARAELSNGMKAEFALGDLVGCHINQSGCYEPELVQLLLENLTSDTIFFDIGAHVGQYTMFASEIAAEVHAFEPTPETFQFLQRNVSQNRLSNVFVNNFAVADYDGRATFHKGDPSNPGQNSLAVAGPADSMIEVAVRTLDSYIQEKKIDLQRPIVMKVDVEGAEDKVFRGAVSLLKCYPKILFEALSNWPEYEVRSALGADYVLRFVDDSNVLASAPALSANSRP